MENKKWGFILTLISGILLAIGPIINFLIKTFYFISTPARTAQLTWLIRYQLTSSMGLLGLSEIRNFILNSYEGTIFLIILFVLSIILILFSFFIKKFNSKVFPIIAIIIGAILLFFVNWIIALFCLAGGIISLIKKKE